MPDRLLPSPIRRPRALRRARLLRARIRLRLHYWFFVPTIRATTWMYFAAAGLVGFGTLEALVALFALSPSGFPILLLALALVAVTRNVLRRGVRLVRLGVLRRRRQLRRDRTLRAESSP